MTPRQRQLRDFIAGYQAQHGGVSPTYAEMMSGIAAKSKSTVDFLLGQLEKEQRIVRDYRRARSVVILDNDPEAWRAHLVAARI